MWVEGGFSSLFGLFPELVEGFGDMGIFRNLLFAFFSRFSNWVNPCQVLEPPTAEEKPPPFCLQKVLRLKRNIATNEENNRERDSDIGREEERLKFWSVSPFKFSCFSI